MEEIIQFDKELLLMVNGSDSLFMDYLILTLTNAKTWIPLYIGLFYVVLKSNKNIREIGLILAAAGLCYLLAGAVDDGIVKPLVARWRPTHDPEIGSLVDVVNGYRGGKYGFFSAHAANTFSTLINCYTRLYLGVHYPGDITVGLLWGGFVGWLVYKLYCRVTIPAKYDIRHCYVPILILGFTLLTAVVMAFFEIHL